MAVNEILARTNQGAYVNQPDSDVAVNEILARTNCELGKSARSGALRGREIRPPTKHSLLKADPGPPGLFFFAEATG